MMNVVTKYRLSNDMQAACVFDTVEEAVEAIFADVYEEAEEAIRVKVDSIVNQDEDPLKWDDEHDKIESEMKSKISQAGFVRKNGETLTVVPIVSLSNGELEKVLEDFYLGKLERLPEEIPEKVRTLLKDRVEEWRKEMYLPAEIAWLIGDLGNRGDVEIAY